MMETEDGGRRTVTRLVGSRFDYAQGFVQRDEMGKGRLQGCAPTAEALQPTANG